MTFHLLTDLPCELTCTILVTWLSWKHVASVDSAYCCKAKRKFFLTTLTNPTFVMPGIDFHNDKLLEWIKDRSVRVEKLVVRSDGEAFVAKYRKEFGPHLKVLKLGTVSRRYENHIKAAQCKRTITSCINLQKLTLFTQSTSDEVLDAISNLTSLKYLHTDGACISRPQARSQRTKHTRLLHLHTLDLYNSEEGGNRHRELLQMTYLHGLKRLRLRWEHFDNTPETFVHTLKQSQLTNLEALCLHTRSKAFNDCDVISLLKSCRNLQYLDLNCKQIGIACVPYIATLPCLKIVCLHNQHYTGVLMQQLLVHHRDTLEALYIEDQASVNSLNIDQFTSLLRNCPKLTTLCIMYANDFIFDNVFLRKITALVIHFRRFTLSYLARIGAGCKNLNFLGIVDCELEESDLIILDSFPMLHTLHFYQQQFELDNGLKVELLKSRPELTIRFYNEFDLFHFQGGVYDA